MDPPRTMRRVWILGAGFSRPLNGPLMNDLLADREPDLIAAGLPPQISDDDSRRPKLARESKAVRKLCDEGIKQGRWRHAEQFLDIIESAADDDRQARSSYDFRLIEALLKRPSPLYETDPNPFTFSGGHDLVGAARRAVLADTWSFLWGATLTRERWKPYAAWVDQLTNDDTIVTFNYDHVPELLYDYSKKVIVIQPHTTEHGWM